MLALMISANIEYVPLETIDESLLPNMCVFFDVSEKYIITYDIDGGNHEDGQVQELIH